MTATTTLRGLRRQLAAIIASGDRTAELRGIRAPTLVIHGSADPLVAPSGGRATARAIRGAQLLSIAGWATTCRAWFGRSCSTRSPSMPGERTNSLKMLSSPQTPPASVPGLRG